MSYLSTCDNHDVALFKQRATFEARNAAMHMTNDLANAKKEGLLNDQDCREEAMLATETFRSANRILEPARGKHCPNALPRLQPRAGRVPYGTVDYSHSPRTARRSNIKRDMNTDRPHTPDLPPPGSETARGPLPALDYPLDLEDGPYSARGALWDESPSHTQRFAARTAAIKHHDKSQSSLVKLWREQYESEDGMPKKPDHPEKGEGRRKFTGMKNQQSHVMEAIRTQPLQSPSQARENKAKAQADKMAPPSSKWLPANPRPPQTPPF